MRALQSCPHLLPRGTLRKLVAMPMRQSALSQVLAHCSQVCANQLDGALDLFKRALSADSEGPDSGIGIKIERVHIVFLE